MPFGLGLSALSEMLTQTARPDGFEVVLSTGRPLDPLGDADGAREALTKRVHAGATMVSAALSAASVDHYLDQLHALAALAVQEGLL